MTTHVQCRLRKGAVEQVSWIPKKHAVAGGYVKLKEKTGWEDGWLVVDVGVELSTDEVMGMAHSSKDMKKRTDI